MLTDCLIFPPFSVYVHSAISDWKKCIHSIRLKDSVLSIVWVYTAANTMGKVKSSSRMLFALCKPEIMLVVDLVVGPRSPLYFGWKMKKSQKKEKPAGQAKHPLPRPPLFAKGLNPPLIIVSEVYFDSWVNDWLLVCCVTSGSSRGRLSFGSSALLELF